jgi:fucose-binding lectin
MISTAVDPQTGRRSFFESCILWALLLLAALPAFGQQIHQLSYNGSKWADQNLDGPLAKQHSISSFYTTPNDQLHVFYGEPESDDLHQLFYNGSSWADLNLNQAVELCDYCPISGFSVGNFQYVFYVGLDLDVHQMLYNNVGWEDTDLTVASGGPGAFSSNLVALTTSPALHVYYTAADNHIHQLFATNGTNWQDEDLTATTGAPEACSPCLSLAAFNVGNFQYVYYVDNNAGDIHQLLYNNISWSDEDLTALTKSSPINNVYDTLSAFVIPGTKKMRVYFVSGKNGNIIQLASTNNVKWSSSDLTKKAKGSIPDGEIVAFPNASGGKVNVYYVAGHDVNRIYQPAATTWANEDLTALTDGGPADSLDQLVGFSLNNDQYLYYVVD